jgi:hypothetical protein
VTGEAAVLRVAIDLFHRPTQARRARNAPLPGDMHILLLVVTEDQAATEHAATITGRTGGSLKDAASFYIEQTMLTRGSDSYRILGSTPEAPAHELRRNMILLLKWLHPDSQRQADRSVFAQRVLSAWSDLKTPARRAAYDKARQLRSGNGSLRSQTATIAATGEGVTQPKPAGRAYERLEHKRPSKGVSRTSLRRSLLRRALISLFGTAKI